MKLTIKNPFELHYDPKSQALSLIYDETSMGHRKFELAFDPQATRALFDCLVAAAIKCGGTIGQEADKPLLQ